MAKDKDIKLNGISASLKHNFFFQRGGRAICFPFVFIIFIFVSAFHYQKFMRTTVTILLFLLILVSNVPLLAQKADKHKNEPDTTTDNLLLEKQWSLGLQLNTNGGGMKFLKGKNITALKQFMWEIEFSTYKEAKEVKSINPYYSNSKSFIYGKLNYLYFIRGGLGFQRILNRKPYWGGVQLSYHYYGGFSLAIAKPVYLYIMHNGTPSENPTDITIEKYDPNVHTIDVIYGRASFLTGIFNSTLYPGIYVKSGLDFEFGTRSKNIQMLEAGATLDYSPIPIPIMAYNPRRSLFLTLYISFSFGKRYN